ncbi:hypothetical protein [Salinicola lusitanus]
MRVRDMLGHASVEQTQLYATCTRMH